MTDTLTTSSDNSGLFGRIEGGWMRAVQSVTTRFRGWFPYGSNAIEAVAQYSLYLVLSLPILALYLGIASLSITHAQFINSLTESAAFIRDWITTVNSTESVGGLAVSVAYLSSIVKYHPKDPNDYLENSTPTAHEGWELLLEFTAFSTLPGVYLILTYSDSVSEYVSFLGLPVFYLSLITFGVAFIFAHAWFSHRYSHPGVNPEITTYRMTALIFISVVGVYLAQVAFETDLLLYGTGVNAIFVIHLLMMAFLTRRLRWTVYEDWAGFSLNPTIPVWGIARAFFVYAVYVYLVEGSLTETVFLVSFSPFVAAVCYIAWRAYETGDLKTPPDGFRSSPGRKQYEEMRKANAEIAARVYRVRKQVEEFNDFLESHDLQTLEEPSLQNFDSERFREDLEDIHKYEAAKLSGEEYNEYMKHRKNLLELF